jgi:hypothetical protein
MLSVEMLPAQHGDCLWIEYGDPAKPRRILVDPDFQREWDYEALYPQPETAGYRLSL